MRAPTLSDRMEDIRRRAAFLEYWFHAQEAVATANEWEGYSVNPDVFSALEDYAAGLVTAIKATKKALEHVPNRPAPDVAEHDEKSGVRDED